MKLSIVATLYRTSPYIDEFIRRATAVAQRHSGDDYEIVLVNDGSPDNSLELVVRLCESNSHLVVIDLSRNFGHHKAMMTGLAHAKGEQIFLIDSDLEEDPEWLLSFSEQMQCEHCDVVYGIQEERKGGFFERWSGHWFYSIFRALTGLALPRNIVTARLMSRRYVDALLLHKEREIMIAGLWLITGFQQSSHTIKKHNTSDTTYTFRHKVSVLVNSITSFSNAPLIGIFYIGIGIFFTALVSTGYLTFHWLFQARPISGWTSVMVSIWLLGGLVISFIGVVGIYLSKIFSEVKQRPYTIVRNIYRAQAARYSDSDEMQA
ncbi:MAG: glycosyltransferase family 2 protein [Pseudobdellovibrionaceae bacterium]